MELGAGFAFGFLGSNSDRHHQHPVIIILLIDYWATLAAVYVEGSSKVLHPNSRKGRGI